MHRHVRNGTAVVTESAVQATLRRGSQPTLTADEERTIRMRIGAGLPLSARLDRIATATDAEIELLSYEIEAYLVLKERRARRGTGAAKTPTARAPRAATTTSRAKEKIVRALRRKG